MNIVILERSSVGDDVSVDLLNRFGEVTVYNTTPVHMIGERIKDADIVIANKSPLNEETLRDASNVRLICEFATGYDNIDLSYCKKRGIGVRNVKGYSTDAVVQHTFGLCLYIFEKLNYYDNYVKSGAYARQDSFSHYDMNFSELSSKTWGIIGMGAIGSKVADIASAFGCNVVRYSLSDKPSDSTYKALPFDEFLHECDIISIHCPLNDNTRGLFDYSAFSKMKRDAILINVARGGIVVDADLYRALNENLIYGAGLDVTSTEPMTEDNPLSNYKDSNRLIITPHMAWASNEARARVVEETALNIEAFLDGRDRNVIL
ncbi:MAG TPA: D-2-hydroxyacid dehydrogenase [Lachnospiraceae bacterium]|nr:D-2-hydroxyacid dehydrogenase [Lachnospiraceae bacterium]